MIYIFFFIFIYILFYIINNYISKKYIEKFNDNIIFLNKYELLEILLNNEDKYYDSFFKNDFIARNINNIDEYKQLIKESVSNFNDAQINKIKKSIESADKYFSNLHLDWLDGNKMNNLKWIIGCIKGKSYEYGLPHTRNNVIIITCNERNLTKTLIHEKVHIYQKYYKDDIEKYINQNKFIRIKKREFFDNIRANPDLDNWIYKDHENKIYKALYNNNPESIEDINYIPINNQSYEHPYEKMAIEIENNYNMFLLNK